MKSQQTPNQPEHRPLLRVGCPMWANRDWVGPYFPLDTPTGSELEVYTSWCNTVEGNTTFYAQPTPQAVQRWISQTPDSFQFCFKLPKHITHDRRLRNTADGLGEFLDLVEPLGQRLGPIQIQLPASFGPADVPVLQDFLSEVPRSFDWAVEVRHLSFFAGGEYERPLNDLLATQGINRVILDSRALFASPPVTPVEIETWEAKPRVPVRPVATAQQPLVRLIGQTNLDASLEHWQPWVAKVSEWLRAGLEPHVFTHTPDNRQAPELARRFWDLVASEVDNLTKPPTQLVGQKQMGLDL